MPVSAAPNESNGSESNPAWPSAARWVRRVHMYLGLFLTPWMFIYAVSTMVMNHREWVQSFYPSGAAPMRTERQLDYSPHFPPGATPQAIGRQILLDLGMDGSHRVSGGKDGQPLVIERYHAWSPSRITWNRDTRSLVVAKQEFRGPAFLERMHRRRGYQQPYALDDTWAFSVDLAVTAMVFWALSGLWLWWELRPTRLWGTVCALSGLALFGVFLALL
jgi:hypothetical protein